MMMMIDRSHAAWKRWLVRWGSEEIRLAEVSGVHPRTGRVEIILDAELQTTGQW